MSSLSRHGLAALFLVFVLRTVLPGNGFCDTWDPVMNADWAVVLNSVESPFGAVMLFEKMVVDETDLADKNRIDIEVYRRIRILGRRGYEAAKVIVPRVHRKQEIRRIEGRTLLPDGRSVTLSDGNIYRETVLDSRTMKVGRVSFEMPGVTGNCIVEYRFTYRISGAWTSRLHLDVIRWAIQKTIPLRYAECRWRFPADPGTGNGLLESEQSRRDFLALNTGNTLEVDLRRADRNIGEYIFTLTGIPPFKREPHAPPIVAAGALLYMFHTEPNYWFNVSSTLRESLHAFAEKDGRISVVLENLGDLETEQEKVGAAYRYLQDNIDHLDYIGDSGDREENSTVDDVIRRGYGTQQDINYVLWDMLRHMGIEALVAHVADRNEHWFAESGRFWQFQRTLVVVPTGDGFYRFYSPGDPQLPPAHVPWFNEGSAAFVILADEGYSFVEIPYSTGKANETVRLYSLSVDGALKVSGGIIQATSGHGAREIRLMHTQVDDVEAREHMEQRLTDDLLYSEVEVRSIDDGGTGGAHVAEFDVEYRDRLPRAGGWALMRPIRYMSRIDNPFSTSERRQPVMFDFARRIVETVELKLPEGWAVEALPQSVEFENAVGSCGVSFWGGDGRLYAQRLLEVRVPVLPKESSTMVYELFEKAAGFQAISVLIAERQ